MPRYSLEVVDRDDWTSSLEFLGCFQSILVAEFPHHVLTTFQSNLDYLKSNEFMTHDVKFLQIRNRIRIEQWLHIHIQVMTAFRNFKDCNCILCILHNQEKKSWQRDNTKETRTLGSHSFKSSNTLVLSSTESWIFASNKKAKWTTGWIRLNDSTNFHLIPPYINKRD